MFILCLTAFGISANAATFVVTKTADTADGTCDADCSLREAITAANALAGADIITLPAGTYTATLTGATDNTNVAGDFDINSEITINGAGAATTIVQAAATRGTAVERVFHLRATGVATVLNGLTIRYGRYTAAAGTFGAGIRIDVGAVNATLNNVVVTENDDGSSGGGIAISGATGATLTVNNSTISNNTAVGSGAGVQANSVSTVNFTNTMITGNQISSSTGNAVGGGISTISGVTLNIIGSTLNNNSAVSTFSTGVGYGGGIHAVSTNTTISGSTLTGNSSSGHGAAINYWHSVTAARTVAITNSTISNNTSSNTNESGAGGVTFDNFASGTATLNISGSNFTGNASNTAGIGGGLYVWAESGVASVNVVTINNSTFSGNSSTFGGGILNECDGTASSTVNLNNSTINTNTSAGNGGGLYNFDSSTTTGLAVLNVNNSTVSGNSGANGGGITNEIGTGATATGPTVNLDYTTVASNTATTNGGGLQQLSGAINLKDSIVADNNAATGPDIFGTITSQDYNHIENISGGTFFSAFANFAGGNDVTGTDPQLSALANNGGTTQTQAVAPASPVVNTIPSGTNGCGTTVATDQRGSARPYGGACEKGSFEYLAPTAAQVSVGGRVLTANGSGIRNVRLTLTDSHGVSRTVLTGTFGNYSFDNVSAGETYLVSAAAKNYTFSQPAQALTVNDSLTGVNFVAR